MCEGLQRGAVRRSGPLSRFPCWTFIIVITTVILFNVNNYSKVESPAQQSVRSTDILLLFRYEWNDLQNDLCRLLMKQQRPNEKAM